MSSRFNSLFGIAISLTLLVSPSLAASQEDQRPLLEFSVSLSPLNEENGGSRLCLVNDGGANTLWGPTAETAADYFTYEVVGAGLGLDLQNVSMSQPAGWSCAVEVRRGNFFATMRPAQTVAIGPSGHFCFELTGVDLANRPTEFGVFQRRRTAGQSR